MWQLAGKDAADRETWYKQMPAGLTRSGTRHPAQLRHQADLEAHMVEAKACSPAAWDVRAKFLSGWLKEHGFDGLYMGAPSPLLL